MDGGGYLAQVREEQHRGADSDAGFKGLAKKCVMLALVWMGALLDQATSSDFVRDAVCMFFIANEGLSILENTAIMGVPSRPL